MGIKDLGLDRGVVVISEGGGISLFLLVFAQKDDQLFFHNFQVFFQALQFLLFVVVVGVILVLVTELC